MNACDQDPRALRPTPAVLSATLLLLAAAFGCSSPPQSERWAVNLEPDERHVATLTDSAVMGVAALLPLDSGQILVADPFLRRLTWLNEDTVIRRAGAAGDGPGEFQDIASLFHLETSLAVFDSRAQRLTLLDTAGGLITVHPLGDGRPLLSLGAIGQRGLIGFAPFPRATLLTADSIDAPWNELDLGELGYEGGDLVWGSGPSGRVYVAPNRDYRLVVIPATGVSFEIALEAEPVPFTAEELAAAAEGARRFGGPRASEGIPEVRASIQEIVEDPCGRVWIRTPRGGTAATVYDVLDASGEILGEVTIGGPRISQTILAGDHLFGVLGRDGWVRVPLGRASCPT